MARGYFAEHISDNLLETPEGYLIAPGCVIARTGFQTYSVKDLPQEAAADMGVDLSDPGASIDLYRAPEDVFHPATLASAEGKPITDDHPPDFVTAENFKKYACGHIQNVRKGEEGSLEDGNTPMLADLVITTEPLLSQVRSKTKREISLGYDYGIRREGDKICQCDMVVNHNAIVTKGRAGKEARINDSAPEPEPQHLDATPQRASPPPQQEACVEQPTEGINPPITVKKEKPKVSNWTKNIFGRGLRALAADAAIGDEELAEAAKAMSDHPSATEAGVEESTPSADKKGKDKKKGKDNDPAITADPDQDHEESVPGDDRKRLHDAFDRMLDKARDKKRGKDSDIEELKDLLGEYLSEEEGEPAHASEDEAEVDPTELDNVLSADEANTFESEDEEGEPGEEVVASGEEELEPEEADDAVAGECAHCGTAHDAANCPECGCKDRKADDAHAADAKAADKKHAKDRARAADGVAATLRMLRPVIARSNDTAVKKAFNTAFDSLTKASKPSTTSYSSFAKSASARDSERIRATRAKAADTINSGPGRKTESELQAAYDAALKGGK